MSPSGLDKNYRGDKKYPTEYCNQYCRDDRVGHYCICKRIIVEYYWPCHRSMRGIIYTCLSGVYVMRLIGRVPAFVKVDRKPVKNLEHQNKITCATASLLAVRLQTPENTACKQGAGRRLVMVHKFPYPFHFVRCSYYVFEYITHQTWQLVQ
jgi:hypothetical protein